MTKGIIAIKNGKGFENVEGYITADGKYGLVKHGKVWNITDIPTGLALSGAVFKTRKEAIGDIARAEEVITSRGVRETEAYKRAVKELKKFKGVVEESEVKKMAKTNTAKAEPKAKRNNYKKQVEELKKEIEILKKQIERTAEVEKITIDTFDVEGYLNTRDNSARITTALVEALENTEGLTVTRKGKDEWLYVSGKTAEDTKNRKDIFKAMGFRWSGKESAWFIAPYPLANGKRWANKKARANATA